MSFDESGFDHFSAPPGSYVFNEEGEAVARITIKTRVDARGTAGMKYSIQNGAIAQTSSGHVSLSKSNARRAFREAIDKEMLRTYSVWMGRDKTLPLEAWIVHAGQELGIQGVETILAKIATDPEMEEEAKIKAINTLYDKELTRRNIADDPEVIRLREEHAAWAAGLKAKREEEKRKEREEAEKQAEARRKEWAEERERRSEREAIAEKLIFNVCKVKGLLVQKPWSKELTLPDWLEGDYDLRPEHIEIIISNPMEYIIGRANHEKCAYPKGIHPFGEYVWKPPHQADIRYLWKVEWSMKTRGKIDWEVVEELALQMIAEMAVSKFRTWNVEESRFRMMSRQELLKYNEVHYSTWGNRVYERDTTWGVCNRRYKGFFKRLRPDIAEDLREDYGQAACYHWQDLVGDKPIYRHFKSNHDFLDILHMESPRSPMRKLTKFSKSPVANPEIDCAARGAGADL